MIKDWLKTKQFELLDYQLRKFVIDSLKKEVL